MTFGLWARMGPRNRVLYGGPDPLWEVANLGQRGAHCKVYGHSAVTYAKIAKPILMQFGLWARSASRNHEKDGVPIPHKRGNFGGKGPPL